MVDLFQFYSIYSNGDITEILLLVYNLTLNSNHLSHKATTIFLSGDGGGLGFSLCSYIFFQNLPQSKYFFSHEKESKNCFSYHVEQKYIFP